MRITAITCVKNEAAFFVEWLAHHKAIGITNFLVFSNDCTDGTLALLDRLEAMGQLQHIRNDGPYDQGGVQWTAFKAADKHPLVHAADWLITLDVDEFINIHTGNHTLGALFDVLPEADAISLTWRLFGNAGVVHYKDQPITEQFTLAAPKTMSWPWRAYMFKTLYRNIGAYKKLGVHRPRAPQDGVVENMRWYDGQGRRLDESYQRKRLFSQFNQSNYGLVQLNHYPLGAMESFIIKSDRGRVNRADRPISMDYWCERNWNCEQDISIQNSANIRADAMAALMQDPQIKALHLQAVAWRKAQFIELMQDEHNRALMGRLLITPPSQPISHQTAQNIYRHSALS